MKNNTVIIDCGHGGVTPEGVYTTAPKKMFTFEDGTVAYEGVTNREIGAKLQAELVRKGIEVAFTVLPIDPTDKSLRERVAFANEFPPKTTMYISLHSNASASHKARGFEVFTSVGETRSDVLAEYIGKEIAEEFPDIRFRADYSDGDIDKESQFYVLRKTKCPAVLIENLFFDNIYDYKLLASEVFQNRLVKRISNGIIRYIQVNS